MGNEKLLYFNSILNGYAIHSNIQQALEQVIVGEKTSKEALEEAEKKTKEDIDQSLKIFIYRIII